MSQTRWSLGVLIGLPILLLIILVLAAVVIYGLVLIRREGFHDSYGSWEIGPILSVWGGVALVVMVLITAGCFFPWKAEYHQWRPVSGKVTDVSSRILGGGGDINQRFVVTFANGLTRSCDDTRCSLIKPGDYLTLTCKKHWQFAGASGYDCNFVSRKGGAR